MILANYNPRPLKAGADWSLTFILRDPDTQDQIDLSGWSGTCQIKDKQIDGKLLLDVTVTFGTGDDIGTIVLSLTGAQTATLPPSQVYGDCYITDNGTPAPVIHCLWDGAIDVMPQLTEY